VDPQTYDAFADHALFPFVRAGWQQIVMAQPAFWGSCLMAGEIVLGTLLLVGGRAARWGWRCDHLPGAPDAVRRRVMALVGSRDRPPRVARTP
jgi:hypothetical protein